MSKTAAPPPVLPIWDSTTGPCALCRQPTERYGDRGKPLCGECQPSPS